MTARVIRQPNLEARNCQNCHECRIVKGLENREWGSRIIKIKVMRCRQGMWLDSWGNEITIRWYPGKWNSAKGLLESAKRCDRFEIDE